MYAREIVRSRKKPKSVTTYIVIYSLNESNLSIYMCTYVYTTIYSL